MLAKKTLFENGRDTLVTMEQYVNIIARTACLGKTNELNVFFLVIILTQKCQEADGLSARQLIPNLTVHKVETESGKLTLNCKHVD